MAAPSGNIRYKGIYLLALLRGDMTAIPQIHPNVLVLLMVNVLQIGVCLLYTSDAADD